MALAFPPGYHISRDSPIDEDPNTSLIEMDDGSIHEQILGEPFTTIQVSLGYMTQAEMQTLLAFIRSARGIDVTWTIDGIDYIGRIRGPIRRTMTGITYNVSFGYRARVNAA